MTDFSYSEFTTRNIGFVTEEEQQLLRNAKVFVAGVGGMGGACVQALVRCGIGSLGFADFDKFDFSNLNRQPFAFVSTAGHEKVATTKKAVLDINPGLNVETYDASWVEHLDTILSRYKIIVNGMDDVRASILLYRKAKEHGATVIDSYMSPLPSVFVVGPNDPRPEERLSYGSRGLEPLTLDDDVVGECVEKEVIWVMTHSSSANHIDLEYAAEVVAGKRSRMSFAPMVLSSGNLMCFETINAIFKNPGCSNKGYFFNPWTRKVEHPLNPAWGWLKSLFVKRFLKGLTNAA